MLYIVMAAALITSILGVGQQNSHAQKVTPHTVVMKAPIKTSKVEKPRLQGKALASIKLDGVELANLSEPHHA